MTSFKSIRARAISRKGNARTLNSLLPVPATPASLRKIPDDRWLAAMTRVIFQTGFNSAVITRRWGNFERAFAGFDPIRWADMSARDKKRLLGDANIVRNPQKIEAVKANARLLIDLAEEHGTAARAFAAWPSNTHHELLLCLRERGSRLGGLSGQTLLRSMGKDSYLLTPDVINALSEIELGEIELGKLEKRVRPDASAGTLSSLQEHFNMWQQETQLPLCQLSKILACSAGYNHSPSEMSRWQLSQ